jgi:hypothetical protein
MAKHPIGGSPPKLGGVARRCFISRAGVVPKQNHPVCALKRWLRDILINGAATPPNLGGEFLFGGFAAFICDMRTELLSIAMEIGTSRRDDPHNRDARRWSINPTFR